MELLKYPNPMLLTKCEPITVFSEELWFLADRMFETMKAKGGMGLAANQVGLRYRLFVMETPDGETLFVANPKIISKSAASANLREGCLSAPGEFLVLAERASWVQIEFDDMMGTKVTRVFHGLNAVCVQHEIDHLNGKSHLQAMSIPKQKRMELAKKWGLK